METPTRQWVWWFGGSGCCGGGLDTDLVLWW
ncbi:hypothetical protein L195_g064240, partial [Trifolium pratense]